MTPGRLAAPAWAMMMAMLLGACGGAGAAQPAAQTTPPASPRACGALARLDLADEPTRLLADHVRMRMPEGTESFVGRSRLGPRPPEALETQLEARAGEGRVLRVIAMEVFRSAGDDLAPSVAEWLGTDASLVDILDLEAPIEGVFTAAGEEGGEGLALVGRAVVRGADMALINVSFFVSREVVAAEGISPCAGVARRIAETLTAGERRIDLEGGRVALSDLASITLPPGYATHRHPGRDFEVHYFYPLADLDAPHAQLGVYLGTEPASHIRDVLEMRSAAGAMLGRSVEWQIWTTARRGRRITHMEAMVEIPGGEGQWAHAFLVGEDEETVEALKAVAETLSLAVGD